ncbi:phosphatase PAP2 family protein [Candidatus Deianiraea vastatrix]|uniref:PAP2 superfamily phosphatase n=1 Tax=Candidatus Deianiraea vastatrix TaxID=2163644 RepID=A0A5B8XFW3_9RICK|nr:phosphatase PAP2 family protein [Candidatus Deianiraea vastatrix]QED22877.1 Putative PAP2 superfamily phosphatase [Candidatus Deianiraea vastatrix]
MLKFLKIRNRFDKISLLFALITLSFVAIFKLFPEKFGIDWTKSKKQIHKNIDLLHDENGRLLTKHEGKIKYFKMLGKTDEQIKADEIATYYLRGAWVFPQFMPQFFNVSAVGGLYNVSLASTYVITHALKVAVHKKRPDGGNYKSFPSGHTSGTVVLGGFLHRFHGIKIGAPFYLLGIATGASRIYADRHDIYDVTAGAIVGFFCGYYINSILIAIVNRILPKSKRLQRLHRYLFEPLK